MNSLSVRTQVGSVAGHSHAGDTRSVKGPDGMDNHTARTFPSSSHEGHRPFRTHRDSTAGALSHGTTAGGTPTGHKGTRHFGRSGGAFWGASPPTPVSDTTRRFSEQRESDGGDTGIV